jgi:hypothetical protein
MSRKIIAFDLDNKAMNSQSVKSQKDILNFLKGTK